jgi:hypothetical protein
MRVLSAIALPQFASEQNLGVRSLLRKKSCEKTGKKLAAPVLAMVTRDRLHQ